jgi:ATP-binding cassette subfamily B protein
MDPFAGLVPEAPKTRYRAPRAGIDPDTSKTWFKRILPIIKSHKVAFVMALFMSFVGLMIQVQIPIILKWAFENAKTTPITDYAWAIGALGLAAGISGFISRRFLYVMAYNFEYDLRNLLYEHFTKMSFAFFDRVQTGQLISRANSDIRSVQMYATFAPLILVNCSIAVVAFCYMITISWWLSIIAMSTMPLIYVVGLKMRQDLFPVSWIIQSRLADVATIVDENINGVRVVKSFAAEERQVNELADAAERVKWAYVKDADLRARWGPLIQNLPQVGLVLVLLSAGLMIIYGHMNASVILTFNLYLFMMQAPFMMLGQLVMMGQRAAASADRIFEILDEVPTIVNDPGATNLPEAPGAIVFSDVTFAYGEPPAHRPGEHHVNPDELETAILRHLNLTIAPGESVAIVGRTGSGKSTIARLLTRFYDVTNGAITIGGLDVRDATLESLRARIGMVLDEPFLFSASISDNIAYGRPDASHDEIVAAATAAGADTFIRRLPGGYDSVVGERGYTLSGGQRQRIAIARTLLVNPPILVLDDATSAIDVHVESQIHAALETLLERRTTVIIAHRLSTISLASRVVLLDDGRIVADGTHQDLLATVPLYAEVLAQAASLDAADDVIDGEDA